MTDVLLDSLETASPYIVCAVAFFALGAGVILYFDRNQYKHHIRCAGCRKKMFSVHQDDKTSDNFTENERENLKALRYFVTTGQVSEDIQ